LATRIEYYGFYHEKVVSGLNKLGFATVHLGHSYHEKAIGYFVEGMNILKKLYKVSGDQ
jgi:hypothetical protein